MVLFLFKCQMSLQQIDHQNFNFLHLNFMRRLIFHPKSTVVFVSMTGEKLVMEKENIK